MLINNYGLEMHVLDILMVYDLPRQIKGCSFGKTCTWKNFSHVWVSEFLISEPTPWSQMTAHKAEACFM